MTDLVNVGQSIAPGLGEIVKQQGRIKHVIAVIKRSPDYRYQPFSALGVELSGLLHVSDVIEQGRSHGYISDAQEAEVRLYLNRAAEEEIYKGHVTERSQ